jgi:hypothetical protein
MSAPSRSATFVFDANATVGEPITAHRARLAVEADQRAEVRRAQLEEQRSTLNTPEVRIAIWEKTHNLRLPLDPSHPVLDVIAVATRLTLDQVREEQQARRAKARPSPA